MPEETVIPKAILPLYAPGIHKQKAFVSEMEALKTLLKIDLVFVNNGTGKKIIENIQKYELLFMEGFVFSLMRTIRMLSERTTEC